jgi:hypothetical protein
VRRIKAILAVGALLVVMLVASAAPAFANDLNNAVNEGLHEPAIQSSPVSTFF